MRWLAYNEKSTVMKRILLFISAAAMFVAGSCQKNQHTAEPSDLADVTFSIDLPVAPTKAIGDGLSAVELYYAVFNQEGGYINSLAQQQVVAVSGKKATVELKLVRQYTYSIVFWAQAPGAPYTFTPATGTVAVDYSGDANDDLRDAFCALHKFTVPDAAKFGETVTLTRPFAQINFGAADFAPITELGLAVKSTVAFTGLANQYDILNGKVSGDAATSFAATTVPAQYATPETLTVGNVDYAYVSMNYILAPISAVENKLANITATFEYNGSSVVVNVPNVPYKRNFRTNIIGDLFTTDATFNIVVDEAFLNPDFIVE